MKIILFAVLDLFLLTLAAGAQTIGTPIAEFTTKPGKISRGSFQIQNDQLQPVAFTIESYSISFNNQKLNYRALDAGVKVELSQTSGRLGPKEIRRFDYKISCDSIPCTVGIQTGLVIGRTKDGMQVRIILPHLAYLNLSKHPRQDTLTVAGILTAQK